MHAVECVGLYLFGYGFYGISKAKKYMRILYVEKAKSILNASNGSNIPRV